MSSKRYSNFVRPGSSDEVSRTTNTFVRIPLTGDEAKKIYVNEVKHIKDPVISGDDDGFDKILKPQCHTKRLVIKKEISDKELFLSVQNDDIDTLKSALDSHPDSINKLDDYGWSLLMIACQASSKKSVKELLKRGCNTAVRDKAGNSAQSLVIKNKNYVLADILLSNIQREKEINAKRKRASDDRPEHVEEYFCEMCNMKVKNKGYHLSSTVHNINLSKGKKIRPNYVIPESNKGYQIMLKVGWDKESGLGPDGSGKKYPIRTVQKKDRKGLGHDKKVLKTETVTKTIKQKNRKTLERDHESNRTMEINFRRQFY